MIIAQQNIHFLDQGLDLVRRIGDLYAQAGPHGQASPGAHMRHVLDCYRCFLRGVERTGASTPTSAVDYDDRQRDARVETDGIYASAILREVVGALQCLGPTDLDRPLRVKVDAAAWQGQETLWSVSTVARELQFLLSHTVHHYALMSLILRFQGFDPGDEFGVAPSTLAHRCAASPMNA